MLALKRRGAGPLPLWHCQGGTKTNLLKDPDTGDPT